MKKFFQQFENMNFSRLWWAQLISQFGDRIHQMALIGLMAQRSPGSAVELAKLLSFTIIPVFLIGPVAGVYVDRWDRRTTLFVCDFLRGLLVLTIPFIFIFRDSMGPIYVVVFSVFCLSRFYVPAKMSIIPDLVEDEHLLRANSLLTTTGVIAFTLGCALGGFLVDRVGARGGFICDAVTFFISGVLVFSMTMPLRLRLNRKKILASGKQVIAVEKSVLQEIRAGLVYLIQHREIRFIINMLFVLFSAAGAVYVVMIVFIQQAFGSVTRDLGILAVVLGIGLFLGVLLHGRWGQKVPLPKIIFLCLGLGGMMLVVFAATIPQHPSLVLAGVLVLVLGTFIGPIFIAANTIAHQFCQNEMRGKVFSALEVVIHFAFLVAMLVSSVLAERISSAWILTVVGAVLAVVGAAGIVGKEGNLALEK